MSESDPDRVDQEIADALRALPQHLQKTAATLPSPLLHHACMAGHVDLVRALLNAGVAPDLYPETDDEDDQPPLTWLARDRANASANALQVVVLLVDHCGDIDEGSPLGAALEASDLSMIRLLLAAGASEELARQEVGQTEGALLDALLEPYWRSALGTEPRYFIAYDEDEAICAVGLSEADATTRAKEIDSERTYEANAATEPLVAAFLSGKALNWSARQGIAEPE